MRAQGLNLHHTTFFLFWSGADCDVFFLQRMKKCFGTLDFSNAPTITEEEKNTVCQKKNLVCLWRDRLPGVQCLSWEKCVTGGENQRVTEEERREEKRVAHSLQLEGTRTKMKIEGEKKKFPFEISILIVSTRLSDWGRPLTRWVNRLGLNKSKSIVLIDEKAKINGSLDCF